jgi:hypothetical protein
MPETPPRKMIVGYFDHVFRLELIAIPMTASWTIGSDRPKHFL